MLRIFVVALSFATVMQVTAAKSCRFAGEYTRDMLLHSEDARTAFLLDIVRAEGKFQAPLVGFDELTGYTYDGHMLDYFSGELLPGGLHLFSAPSKESIHVAILTLALLGNSFAQEFVLSSSGRQYSDSISLSQDAKKFSISLMARKMASYLAFNASYPGYGGFMPWVQTVGGKLLPADGWDSQVRKS
jgi:hypothetical protein